MVNKMINYIKEKRRDKNLTQTQVADQMGISRSHYVKLEMGNKNVLDNIRFNELKRLAEIYDLSVYDFVSNYEAALNSNDKYELIKNNQF